MAKHPTDDTPPLNILEMMKNERDRLTSLRENLVAQLKDLDQSLAAINRYFEEPAQPAPRKQAARTSSGTRAPQGGRQEQILTLLKETPGMTRADFLEKLNAPQGSKVASAISQALTTMRSKGQLTLDGGRYNIASTEPAAT